jgi:uncharacterized protein YndB with AHSA1/START domain
MKSIRKELILDAPVAKVWAQLVDPAKLAGWLMPNTFDATPGMGFRMDCGTEGTIEGMVREVVPLKKLVYTWTSKHLKIETLVTVTLIPEKGKKTRLILVHSGWEALPPSEEGLGAPFDLGWDACLKKLGERMSLEEAP